MLPPFPQFTQKFHSSVYDGIDPHNPRLSSKGKIVLVTGGSKGIGKSIAAAFSSSGARAVVILGRTASDLNATAKELSAIAEDLGYSTLVQTFVVDIADADSLSDACRLVRKNLGPIDVFVHNAASIYLGNLESSVAHEYWASFEVNVKGTLNCIQAFLRHGLDQDAPCLPTFINISTIGIAMDSMPEWSCYAASKLAAWNVVDHLRVEKGGQLRVFSIHPGRIATGMAKKAGIPTGDDKELPGAFCVWLAASAEADFLQGRLVACNWDVNELIQRKDEIIKHGLLRLTLAGWVTENK